MKHFVKQDLSGRHSEHRPITQNASQAYALNIFNTLPTTKCQLSYFIFTCNSRIHFYLDIVKNGGWAMFNRLK